MATARFLRLTILLLSVALLPAFGENSHLQPLPLPDAPTPIALLSTAQQAPPPDAQQHTRPAPPQEEAGQLPVHRSYTASYRVSKWYGVIDPGVEVQKLTKHDKLMFWAHESITPTAWFPIVYSAGWGQLTNSDPKYGTDSAAFGERFGAAALRVTSFRFFCDSLFPVMTREDPRYFRKAYGSIWARGFYSASRVVITRSDAGETTANYSSIAGHLSGSALTMTYYPAVSSNATVVFETFAWSIFGGAGGNVFLEFWPDVRDAVFRRHRRAPATIEAQTPPQKRK